MSITQLSYLERTRNIIVLNGHVEDVKKVFETLSKFSGVEAVLPEDLTNEKITSIHQKNKSVVTYNTVVSFPFIADNINVNPEILEEKCFIYNNINPNGNISKQFHDIALCYQMDVGYDTDELDLIEDYAYYADIDDLSKISPLYQTSRYANNFKILAFYESENFFAIPSVGQFIPMVSILPKRKVSSFSALTREELKEFMDVLSDVKGIVRIAFSSPHVLVWENGLVDSSADSYANINIAPSNITCGMILYHLSIKDFVKINSTNILEHKQHNYILIQESNDSWEICDNPDVYIPHQYIRKLLAEEYDCFEKWDWLKLPYDRKRLETKSHIQDALKIYWSILSKKIQENVFNLF